MTSLDFYLQNKASVAIGGHVRPDGDCTGSCLAVYNYVKNNYPEMKTDLYLETIPEKFGFLTGSEYIQDASAANRDEVYDLFIALDCGSLDRLGAAGHFFETAKQTFCIDHHKTNAAFADENYILPDASSASELVYDLLDPEKMTKEIAECLYLGIAHDTGVFQYSCTSSKTMETAGKLMDFGIDYPKIVDESYYIKTFAQNKIWGKAMLDSRLCLDGKVIYSCLTFADMDAFGVTSKDLDGIVSNLRSTVGVEVAIFAYELSSGEYKYSMRSASYVDVSEIAASYGGGGHARAAGFSVSGAPEDVLQKLLSALEQQL